jgi:hypothetical protein
VVRWNKWTRFSQCSSVSGSAQVGDPARVSVAGVEVEGRIEAVESSTLRVPHGI